jgi:hypothetical protein
LFEFTNATGRPSSQGRGPFKCNTVLVARLSVTTATAAAFKLKFFFKSLFRIIKKELIVYIVLAALHNILRTRREPSFLASAGLWGGRKKGKNWPVFLFL